MTGPRPTLGGRVYRISTTPAGEVGVALADVALEGVQVRQGELVAGAVTVCSRAVLVEVTPAGELRGKPMDPIRQVDGGLRYDPSGGGVRMRENRLAGGAFNNQVAEATRFGMVNALYHCQLAATKLNAILGEFGAPALPPLRLVVAAHSGSRLPGFAQGDADFRRGQHHPLSGGHYRLSTITTGVPEPFPVAPTGEVHLGPGRHREAYAGEASYLRNAAHSPATIYHEYGHHLCRHTADFRLNAERAPERQRNGKTGPEEGICDYLAASLLGSGRPYGWYRPSLGERRDPEASRLMTVGDEDPHAIGAGWAGAFWRIRQHLAGQALIAAPETHDRIVVDALLRVGSVGASAGRNRRQRQANRNATPTIIGCYLEALAVVAGTAATHLAERVFREARLATGRAGEELAC